MKKIFIIGLLFAFSLAKTLAQDGANKAEMMESLRIAFITKQLQLTPEEAQKFWPVYNIYQQEQRKLVKEKNDNNGSELEFEEKLLNLRKRYHGDFVKTISEEKFNQLMKAERNWGEMVRKEIQRRKENGERPMMRPPQRN